MPRIPLALLMTGMMLGAMTAAALAPAMDGGISEATGVTPAREGHGASDEARPTGASAATASDSGYFVQISSPDEGAEIDGLFTVRGVVGGQATGADHLLDQQRTSTVSSMSLAAGDVATLWFHGDEIDDAPGVGAPAVGGAVVGQLLDVGPHGATPVAHTGALDTQPVVLSSLPLEHEVLLGDGDFLVASQAEVSAYLSIWTVARTNPTLPLWVMDLRAVGDGPTLPLAQTLMHYQMPVEGTPDRGALPSPVPTLATIPLELGQVLKRTELATGETSVSRTGNLPGAPTDSAGDLVIPAGYRIELGFRGFADFQAGSYSLYYDATDFASRLELPVSMRTGAPPQILSFAASPARGQAPLEVQFAGAVEAGVEPVASVQVDPGDGSPIMTATFDNGEFHAQHAYLQPGAWVATAVARDATGRSSSATTTVVAHAEPVVYVAFNDGPRQSAADTSAAGDWSTWELTHDFGVYPDGSLVTISAVFFDGLEETPKDTVTVIAGPRLAADIAIESPANGSTLDFPALFGGTYSVPADGGGESAGSASESSPAGEGQGGTLEVADAPQPGREGAPGGPTYDVVARWLSEPFVQEAFASPDYRTLQLEAAGWDGFLAVVPDPDTRTFVVVLTGRAPEEAPQAAGTTPIRYLENTELKPLSLPSPQEPESDHGPNLPGIQGGGAGPGAPLRMGGFICTAAFLVQDQNTGRYFISTAGHCLTSVSGEFLGKKNPNAVTNTVSVCIQNCIMNVPQFGTWLTFRASGEYHPVFYARELGVGSDFGLIEVPDDWVGQLRPYMTQWGGPDAMQNPTSGQLLAHYGHGSYCCPAVGAVATRTPVDQGRVAVSLGTSGASFSGLGWPTGGDSGSGVSTAVAATPGIIEGRNAAGVLTHGIVVAGLPLLSGTTMTSGIARANAFAGTNLRLVTQHEVPTPQCPSAAECQPVAKFTYTTSEAQVSFDASSSYHPRYVPVVSYVWDFGDGTTGDGKSVTHGYNYNGTFSVKLTVTDANGRQANTTQVVTMQGVPSSWRIERRVVANDGSDVLPWQAILRPAAGTTGSWNFTWDGSGVPAGSYSVHVRLIERETIRASDARSYRVGGPLTASAGGPYVAIAGETVEFVGAAEGGTPPYSFAWDFGDGSTASGEAVQHAYAEEGNYTVRLTVLDADSAVAEALTTANVAPLQTTPVVVIKEPAPGGLVWGETRIHGTFGRMSRIAGEAGTTVGHSDEPMRLSGALVISSGDRGDPGLPTADAPLAPASTVAFSTLSAEPGEDLTLWLHADELDNAPGVGDPNVGDLRPAQLLPVPPHGTVPVAHTGALSTERIVLTSPPLDEETLLGNGAITIPDAADLSAYMSIWTVSRSNPALPLWVVDLRAVGDGPTLPLAQTLMHYQMPVEGAADRGALPSPVPALATIPLELGQVLKRTELATGETSVSRTGNLPGAPTDSAGDLVIPPGYRIELEFRGFADFEAGTYTFYYDAVDFPSRLSLPVSPRMGGPAILSFGASPSSGHTPLAVEFSVVVKTGDVPLTAVEIDPADGSGPMLATFNGSAFTASHTYTEPGSWTALATVRDEAGRSVAASTDVVATRAPGVYVQVNGGAVERAIDTSAAGNWSTWEIFHNFSVYNVGDQVEIRAVYFDGVAETEPHVVVVTAQPPDEEPPEDLAAAISGPARVRVGEQAHYDGFASTGDIVAWRWDFGDGTTAEGAIVAHAWSTTGQKIVTLTVRDSTGAEAMATQRVLVRGGPTH